MLQNIWPVPDLAPHMKVVWIRIENVRFHVICSDQKYGMWLIYEPKEFLIGPLLLAVWTSPQSYLYSFSLAPHWSEVKLVQESNQDPYDIVMNWLEGPSLIPLVCILHWCSCYRVSSRQCTYVCTEALHWIRANGMPKKSEHLFMKSMKPCHVMLPARLQSCLQITYRDANLSVGGLLHDHSATALGDHSWATYTIHIFILHFKLKLGQPK